MRNCFELNSSERSILLSSLSRQYGEYCKMGLSLDLSRGKPNASQLDVSMGLISVDLSSDYKSENGFDCRNYGLLDGLAEMKVFFADVYGIDKNDIVIGGNSSLQLMYTVLSTAMIAGLHNSPRPWCYEENRKWICITPGYDRHFRITEKFGLELIGVPMINGQPDMDKIEELVKDPSVKGVWCVPKYSNPTGTTYTDEVVSRFASMKCAAPDFLVMWDNAYAVHDFDNASDTLLDIFGEAERYGNKERFVYFGSTSKITFPGGGVAFFAAGEKQRRHLLDYLGAETIGFDKLNQLRHLRYFKNAESLRYHMNDLGALIRNKFEIVFEELSVLEGLGVAEWSRPNGGYFISLNVTEGTAKRVFELMKDAGVVLTSVGATYPYGVDPLDRNLRIAPTYPSDDELRLATKILAVAIQIAALEKIG